MKKYVLALAFSFLLLPAAHADVPTAGFAGGGGGSSGVSQIVAGTGISVSPAGGTGYVTVTNTGSGSGTVTNFTAGTLSPLFTTSVATSSTTPALTFLLTNAAATSWFGNATGSSAAPAFNTTVIPNSLINFAAPAAIGSATPAAGSFTNLSSTGTATFATGAIALSALNQSSATTNQVIGWNGSAWVPQTVSGGGGTPAGSSTQVQFNTGGAFAASPSFTYSNSNITLGTSGGGTQGAVSLYGSTSGSSTIQAPPSGSATAIILPNVAGIAGQVFTNTGSNATAWQNPVGVGGNGSDGAITKGNVSETTITQYNATTFSQTASTTYNTISGEQINASSTATFSGTTNVGLATPNTAYGQGNYGNITNSPGPAPGMSPTGPGASNAGQPSPGGGFGGHGGANNGNGMAGGASIALFYGGFGSAGAHGYGNYSDTSGGGGGYLRVCASGALSVPSSGLIEANGGASANQSSGSTSCNGGGSGGGVYLYSLTSISIAGTVEALGGAGGTQTTSTSQIAGGCGGGGGYILEESPSNTGAGTISVAGGAAGAGSSGSTTAGAGQSGVVITITNTPNFPLIAQETKHEAEMKTLALIQQGIGHQGKIVRWTGHESKTFLSALESKDNETFKSTCYLLDNGKRFEGDSDVALEFVGDWIESKGDAA